MHPRVFRETETFFSRYDEWKIRFHLSGNWDPFRVEMDFFELREIGFISKMIETKKAYPAC